jgi:hypothetical protein
MIQCGCGPCFAVKAAHPVRIATKLAVQEFYRDVSAKTFVGREKHFRHASAPDHFDQSVMTRKRLLVIVCKDLRFITARGVTHHRIVGNK